MIRGCLVPLLLAAACRAPGARPEFFVDVGAAALPGAGVSASFGQDFARSDRRAFALELGADFQDVDGGDFFQVRLGVKQTLGPDRERRPVLRYGGTWFRSTGDPSPLDAPGDYLGAYAGAGYEWRTRSGLLVGPEARVLIVNGEGGLGTEVLAQIVFHVAFRF